MFQGAERGRDAEKLIPVAVSARNPVCKINDERDTKQQLKDRKRRRFSSGLKGQQGLSNGFLVALSLQSQEYLQRIQDVSFITIIWKGKYDKEKSENNMQTETPKKTKDEITA